MIRVNMISKGEDVKGQGVGTAYQEIVRLIQTHANKALQLSFNDPKGCQLNHVHTIHPYCYWQMKRSKLPSCMHVHFLPETLKGSIHLPPGIDRLFYRYVLHMYKSADELIVENPIFIEPLTKYGIPKERIHYIPNVVSSKAFFAGNRETFQTTAEKYELAPTAFKVLGVGQMQTRKGVLDFAQVARALPDIAFYWAGGFSFGAITDGYSELKALVDHPPKNLHLLGIVDRKDMNALYNCCDLLFMSSYNELFPMSILEGVNSGIPLLLRDLDLYKKIYFSSYPSAEDVAGFVAKIQQLREDPQAYQRAKEASQKIASDYSEERIAKLWIAYYQGFPERHQQ